MMVTEKDNKILPIVLRRQRQRRWHSCWHQQLAGRRYDKDKDKDMDDGELSIDGGGDIVADPHRRLHRPILIQRCRLYVLLISLFSLVAVANALEIAEDVLPVVIEHPLDAVVAKSEPASLNCGAKGPDLQIAWYKDGQPVPTNNDESTSHRLLLQTGSLFILSVNNGDSGTYYCVVKNKYGEVRSREASLKIATLRDDFKTRPRNTQALIGNRAVMECVPPKGFPEPVVSWKKNDVEFRPQDDDRITILRTGNLIIDKVKPSDAGLYRCVATNMVGQKVTSPAKLSVYEKPYFLQEPRDVTADVGATVLFDCRVSGEPMPSITWKKRNQQMPLARAFIASDNRGLRIKDVELSDEGEYLCQAKNPAGSIETSARLRVHAAPSFVVEPSDVSVESGETATFRCEAKGQPTPASFWSREGQQDLLFPGHTSLDGRIKVSSDGRLTISDVRPADEGNYVCAAMNAAGSSLTKANLKVDSKSLPSNPPPIIEHGHSNQTLMVSASAILPCQATGRTVPLIGWLKNGQPIDIDDPSLDSRYNQLATGSLRISDLRKSDTGVYTCRARNDDGESTWTASLIVEEHTNPLVTFNRMPDISTFPTAPGKPNVFNVTHDGADLEWSAPEKNGATLVTGYILQYFSPELGETWFNVADYISASKYRMRDLKPSHSYVFIVRAENSHGIGPPSAMSDVIRTKPPVTELDRDTSNANLDLDLARQKIGSEQLLKLDEAKTINATAVQLTWKRKRVERLIQGYYIKWRSVRGASVSSSTGIGGGGSSDSSWLNVSTSSIDTYVIGGLKPFTNYEFFVIPYHRSVQGMPSNSLDCTTDEAPPTSPPSEVRVRMMNLTTLRISWRPPPADGINGILKGFQIVILGSGAKYNRNITTNERAASVTLFHLVPGMSYNIKVAAKSNAGVGVFTDIQRVTMDEETLEEHNRLMSGMGSSGDRLLYIIKRPWFIAVAGVLMWMAFVALIAFIWWRWKRSKGKAAARLGMPFIKINDGSVHLTARDALWMDHTNFNSAQRTLLLNNTLNANAINMSGMSGGGPALSSTNNLCGGGGGGGGMAPPLYTQTPHHTDFYIDASNPCNEYAASLLTSTLNNRTQHSQSPQHHYQYAALTTSGGGAAASVSGTPSTAAATAMSTFYGGGGGGGHQIMDDPSPYATTTLVMNNRQKWLKDHMLRGPVLPTNPIPSGPPARFQDSLAANSHTLNSHHHHHHRTNCSTNSPRCSSNGRTLSNKSGTLSGNGGGRRSPPKQTLLDLMPPPPPGAPPPDNTPNTSYLNGTAEPISSRILDTSDHYDAVSDSLLRRDSRLSSRAAAQPTTIDGYRRNTPNNGTIQQQQHQHQQHIVVEDDDEDDSQRSSLMLDDKMQQQQQHHQHHDRQHHQQRQQHDRHHHHHQQQQQHCTFCSSSEADEENSGDDDDDDEDCDDDDDGDGDDDEDDQEDPRNTSLNSSSIPDDGSYNAQQQQQQQQYGTHRPQQPCMGVSASTLSQTSYDGNCSSSTKRSATRLKSLVRGGGGAGNGNGGGQKDLV